MLRILVVEDDPVSARLMTHLLKPFGNCDLATDGGQAVDLFSKSQKSGDLYDVIFLDIMLPQLDGQQVLAHIRDLEAMRGIDVLQGTKVVMTTALSDDQNFLDSHVSGCNAYIVKPVMRETLAETLKSLGLLK